jgi:hypothetical protein
MSEKNQYSVIMYLAGFHEVEVGQKLADCEFGFEKENNQYFLSTVVSAESIEEARFKGESRLNQVLSILVVNTGIYYQVSGIHINQISGEKPFVYMSPMAFQRIRYLPFPKEEFAKVEELIELLDGFPFQENSTKRIDKAINYFLSGCDLELNWRSESFLNFFKVIELVSNGFRDSFVQTLIVQLNNSLLGNLTEKEIQQLLTPKRLIQYTCVKIGLSDECNISEVVDLRNEFSAHARMKEITVTPETFNHCKSLAGRTIIKYANFIQSNTKNVSKKS